MDHLYFHFDEEDARNIFERLIKKRTIIRLGATEGFVITAEGKKMYENKNSGKELKKGFNHTIAFRRGLLMK